MGYTSTAWWIVFVAFVQGIASLRLSHLEIPQHPVAGGTASLSCTFDMEGDELYSVKWYKGGSEFYRYLPKEHPPAQVYEVVGVKVDLKQSGQNVVVLEDLTLMSTGLYRCEVSAEAPYFNTVYNEEDMMVIALPERGPHLSGVQQRYQVGDKLKANCSSTRSKPAAMLSWTINGEKVSKKYLFEYPIVYHDDGMETSILGIEMQVTEHQFKGGEMKMECMATIAPDYHKVAHELISGGDPQTAPVLESKQATSQVSAGAGCSLSTCSSSRVLVFCAALHILISHLRTFKR